MQYEILYLVGQPQEGNLSAIDKEVEKYISEVGGDMTDSRWEEKRKLAYPISHIERGTYVARRFTLPEQDYWEAENDPSGKDGIQELTQKLNLYKDILRFVVVKADQLPSIEDFVNRKQEERQQKTSDEEKKRTKTVVEKAAKSAGSTQPSKPVTKKDTSSNEEIDKKLDEILNM